MAKSPQLFSQKDSIVDVLQGPKYLSVPLGEYTDKSALPLS